MIRLGRQTRTNRGFPQVEFTDHYDKKCSIQASSMAQRAAPGTSALWLGVDNADPMILTTDAVKLGMTLPPGEATGWMPYPIPEQVLLSTRMHLNRGQVQALINHLQAWLDSPEGQLEVPAKKKRKAKSYEAP